MMSPSAFRRLVPGGFLFFFLCLSAVGYERIEVDGTEFVWRKPSGTPAENGVLVLFGGRNWPGEKTLTTFGFEAVADRCGVVLVSPSFRTGEYWNPKSGSGQTLLKALARIRGEVPGIGGKLGFYGYSAGGQCAALFAAEMRERVSAWGAHGCGVYPEPSGGVPALVTCGTDDAGRFEISRRFVWRYRENGGSAVWKYFVGGHELQPDALELAQAWFEGLWRNAQTESIGEDDTGRVVPVSQIGTIEPEYRNPFPDRRTLELWRK